MNYNSVEAMNDNTIQSNLVASFSKFKDYTAIYTSGQKISYEELQIISDGIADYFINIGLAPLTFIGVSMHTKLDYIFGAIGILKGRFVYVPLDPKLPAVRLHTMIAQLNIKDILTDNQTLPIFHKENFGVHCHNISDIRQQFATKKILSVLNISWRSDDPIYVYFTSGSTGIPKAIIGKNVSVVHFINWEIETFGLDSNCRVSQFINPGFDAWLRDIFVPLLSGGTICIPNSTIEVALEQDLTAWIDHAAVNLIHCVPSFFKLINNSLITQGHYTTLKFVLLSGEQILPHTVKK